MAFNNHLQGDLNGPRELMDDILKVIPEYQFLVKLVGFQPSPNGVFARACAYQDRAGLYMHLPRPVDLDAPSHLHSPTEISIVSLSVSSSREIRQQVEQSALIYDRGLLNDRHLVWSPVRFDMIRVLWDLVGNGTTTLDLGNDGQCSRILHATVERGMRDVLEVFYRPF